MTWLAQATVQLWYADPLCNNTTVAGNGKFPCEFDPGIPTEDRTIRTVFTHDHFSPSTHQQAGLYAGLLVEPYQSKWKMVDGTPMGGREATGPGGGTARDGGPTSWQALIMTPDKQDSYREFMVEFQDKQLVYSADSRKKKGEYVKYPMGKIPNNKTPWGWGPDSREGRDVLHPPRSFPGRSSAWRETLVDRVLEDGTVFPSTSILNPPLI